MGYLGGVGRKNYSRVNRLELGPIGGSEATAATGLSEIEKENICQLTDGIQELTAERGRAISNHAASHIVELNPNVQVVTIGA
jgi:hypothetical protein